ncbi:hypothetical protein HDU99_002253, partial [Rhizoclosmatium hyalinum]
MVRRREGEAMKSAQDVIQSLQRQLAKKDELVERYREMIKDHRKETNAREQDEELSNLRSKYSALKETHKHHLETSETEIHHLRHELSIRNASHHEYETEIEALKRNLHLNEKELALAAEAAEEIQRSRGLQDHVSKLNRELHKRDAKIANMKEAIEQLKEALIKTAEGAAEAKIRESNENLAASADQHGLGDSKRISQLESKIDKMTKTIQSHKKAEKEFQDTVLKITFELDKKERLVEKLQEQYKDAQKALRKALVADSSRGKEKESHSRSGSSRRHADGDDDGGHHDKEKRYAKLLEEEKKNAAEAAKERWEAEKKMQKRVDTMKSKLNEKTQELSEMASREKSLKDSIARLQADNSKLQKKLQTLSGLPAAAVAAMDAQQQLHRREQQRNSDTSSGWRESEISNGSRPSDATTSSTTTSSTSVSEESVFLSPDDPDLTPEEALLRRRLIKTLHELDKVQRENDELAKDVDKWKRKAEVERLKEVKELKRENKKLKAEIEELESDGSRTSKSTTEADDEDSYSDSSSSESGKKSKKSPVKVVTGGFDRTAKPGEKSAHLVPVLESRIKDLMQRIQEIDDKKFKVEQDLVEVKFDKEKAIAEAERQERRVADMEDALKAQAELAAARNAKR